VTQKFKLQERADFETVLNEPEGARVIASLLDFCGVYESSHAIGESNPLDTAFREGRRDVGLMLLKNIKDCPGGELVLLRAQAERLALYEKTLKGEKTDGQ
jgi:hypothetical protein